MKSDFDHNNNINTTTNSNNVKDIEAYVVNTNPHVVYNLPTAAPGSYAQVIILIMMMILITILILILILIR